MKYALLFFVCLLLSFPSHANHTSQTWLRLLHFSDIDERSEIENVDFFLAPNGRDNPKAEFLATIDALQQENNSALCRFPARAIYLKTLGFEVADPLTQCKHYREWLGNDKDNDISVVFADGYLGNPASFYGHLLFKVTSSKGSKDLLNNSLNFGASVPDSEFPLVYIIKGLFGGYRATYSSNHYYRYNINYRELEMRDLWQYTLNLSESEKALLIAHAWELLQSEYTYYFTHRNCAYHIARMLELVVNEQIIRPDEKVVLPITVFSRLASTTTLDGKPAIKHIERQPSSQSRLREQFAQLPVELQNLVDESARHQTLARDIATLSPADKTRVLDILLEYTNFLINSNDDDTIKAFKSQIQKIRIRLPASTTKWQAAKKPLPHIGQSPSMVRTWIGYNEDSQAFVDIDYRPAYYDLLSRGGGILANSALSMGEVSIRVTEDKLVLNRLDLFNVETVDTSASGLPGDVGIAWKMRVGNERNNVDQATTHNEFFAEAGIGKGMQLGGLVLYGLANGRLQSPNEFGQRFFVTPEVAALYETKTTKSLCKLGYPIPFSQTHFNKKVKVTCSSSISIHNNFDARLSVEHQYESELKMGFSWYF